MGFLVRVAVNGRLLVDSTACTLAVVRGCGFVNNRGEEYALACCGGNEIVVGRYGNDTRYHLYYGVGYQETVIGRGGLELTRGHSYGNGPLLLPAQGV